jgi:hypothetical protein
VGTFAGFSAIATVGDLDTLAFDGNDSAQFIAIYNMGLAG